MPILKLGLRLDAPLSTSRSAGLWQALAVGGEHTCALEGRPGSGAAGEVWCWGRNERGPLGTGDRAPTLVVEP